MNIKDYISSGIVESCVMGLATETERQEFELMCIEYPEIREAREFFERELETRLIRDAVPPPAHLKQSIEERVFGEGAESLSPESAEEQPVPRIGVWKWVAAASLILLAGTVFWLVSTNNRYKKLEAVNRNLQNQLQQATTRLDVMRADASLMQKPGVKMATMQGADPSIYATVYWDTASVDKDVYLLVNNLPATASDKQYQLWALLNGKPIDLGMIEAKQERLLIRMKNVQNAQAFAITLEPKGGSAAPTSTPIVASKL